MADHHTGNEPGTILLLQGPPRSGKSSIAHVIQETFEGIWINLGVDTYMKATPKWLQPGIGLRPGGEAPHLEPHIEKMYLALYASIAAHSRQGVHVVADVGHHDMYANLCPILPRCARLLSGLPAMMVGIRCPVDVIMQRRQMTWNQSYEADGNVPKPIALWQTAVDIVKDYDLELDTSRMPPEACAERIRERMQNGVPYAAVEKLASAAPA